MKIPASDDVSWRLLVAAEDLPTPSSVHDLLLINKNDKRAATIDGVVSEKRLAIVSLADLQHWMIGVRWTLMPLGQGNWALLNQGLETAALAASGADGVELQRFSPAWPTRGQTWRLFGSADGAFLMLRNGAGGWLAIADGQVKRLPLNEPNPAIVWRYRNLASGFFAKSLLFQIGRRRIFAALKRRIGS